MRIEDRIYDMISPALEDMGFGLVRVRMTGTRKTTLQVMADRLDEAAISVEDCADISRAISAILDVEDPIEQAYSLEVSSPGIDRPLTRPRDFERFAGHEVKIELAELMEGRRRFRGLLVGVEDGIVQVDTDTEHVGIPLDAIKESRLVLTDALIEASRIAAGQQEGRQEEMAEGSVV